MEKPILAAMLSCKGTQLTKEEQKLFSEYNPLGVSLFSRNMENFSQVKELIEQIKNTINRDDVLIAVDEEGGRVTRLGNIASQKYVSSSELGKVGKVYSRRHAELIANDLKKIGINVNYAPVIDKEYPTQNKVLETRCFSSNTDVIVRHAKEMINSYMRNGICPCIKHLPGHMTAAKDPHLELSQIDYSIKKIKDEIKYIKEFKNCPMAMTAHIVLTDIDKKRPITTSSKGIKEIIRDYLEFDGLLISDAIEMKALSGSMVEKANYCWDAGVDVICYCAGFIEDLTNICQEKRFLTEKSQIRFDKIKKVIHNTSKKTDILEIRKQYNKKFEDKLDEKYVYDATEVLHKMF